MATLNYAAKEISCKVVYYGAALCGKTTNLQRVHQAMPAENRGDLVSLDTDQDRTLFFDFLPLDLGEVQGLRTKFQLYTVPGQVYYSATRKLVLRGVDGVVLVVDSQTSRLDENLESLANLEENLASYGYRIDEMPLVIQYNKRDLGDAMSIEDLQKHINKNGVPYTEATAMRGEGVKETLKIITGKMLEKFSRTGAFARRRKKAPATPVASGEETRETPKSATLSPAAPVQPPKQAARPAPRLPRVNSPGLGSAPRTSGDSPRTDSARPPRVAVKQRCEVYWRGIRVGTASLELTSRPEGSGGGGYQLSERSRFLKVFSRSRSRVLSFQGEKEAALSDQAATLYQFDENDGGSRAGNGTMKVWLRKGSRQNIYARRKGLGGEVLYAPSGQFAEMASLEPEKE